MRFTPDGTPVTSFSVATTRRWNNAEGQPQEKTTWFRVTAWRRLAETCNQYLTKGRLVLVEGDVDASAWSDKTTNEPRATLELTARVVRFLGGKGDRMDSDLPDAGSAPSEEDIPF
jgi:single-strand DNA-binding protein